VVVAATVGDQIGWYPNLGANGFGVGRLIAARINGPNRIQVADLDLDGTLDVAFSAGAAGIVGWVPAAGGGYFAPPIEVSRRVGEPLGLTIADIDGDGAPDLAATGHTSDDAVWFRHGLLCGGD
jgi:hypothetical protein